MYKKYFARTVPIGPSYNISTFKLAPGYNQYHQFCAATAVHTWYEEDLRIQEPDMVSDDEDTQPTVRSKDNLIDRTWIGHIPSVQHFEISDDEDTSNTPEEPKGMVLCIPISPSQDQ